MVYRLIPDMWTDEWQKPVIDMNVNTPPSFPAIGDKYIIGNNPTGAWNGHNYDITMWWNNSWNFIKKREGMIAYIYKKKKMYFYNGSKWANLSTII